jgi:putative endonuclease
MGRKTALFYSFMYTTYILHSKKINKFYSGQTDNMVRRLEEHNRGKTKFMNSGSPWLLVFSVTFDTRSEAVILETKIKKRGAARFLQDKGIRVG